MRSLEVWVDCESYICIDIEKAQKTTKAESEMAEVCPHCGSYVTLDIITIDLIGGTLGFYYFCEYCENDFERTFDLREREKEEGN